jgi:predicted nucleic acid-binding protein
VGVTVDSSFIIDLIRGRKAAVAKAKELAALPGSTLLSTPVLYEVSVGLEFARSKADAVAFRSLAGGFRVIGFDEAAAVRAAEIQVDLMRAGRPRAALAVIIAAIAVAGGHTLISRDEDFGEMADLVGLKVESY